MKKISIVIPAYNEEKRIPKSLEEIKRYIDSHLEFEFEVIVVDDGSKDNTINVVQKHDWVKLLTHTPNKGKGYSLREGVSCANGDYIYLCDADLSTPILELDKLIMEISDCNCVIGSRALAQSKIKDIKWYRKVLGRFGNLLIKIVLRLPFEDTQCGFKLLDKKSKEVFMTTKNNRYAYDFEFLYLATREKLKIKEIPVIWNATNDSTVKNIDYIKTFFQLLEIWWRYR
jgi:dolichyl-phosphate beta-glucosyltransferase